MLADFEPAPCFVKAGGQLGEAIKQEPVGTSSVQLAVESVSVNRPFRSMYRPVQKVRTAFWFEATLAASEYFSLIGWLNFIASAVCTVEFKYLAWKR